MPHDTEVDLHWLRRLEVAEHALRALGFGMVRVRCHGDLARIELDRSEHPRLLDESVVDTVVAALTECGFRYVTLDLQGYRMGSSMSCPEGQVVTLDGWLQSGPGLESDGVSFSRSREFSGLVERVPGCRISARTGAGRCNRH